METKSVVNVNEQRQQQRWQRKKRQTRHIHGIGCCMSLSNWEMRDERQRPRRRVTSVQRKKSCTRELEYLYILFFRTFPNVAWAQTGIQARRMDKTTGRKKYWFSSPPSPVFSLIFYDIVCSFPLVYILPFFSRSSQPTHNTRDSKSISQPTRKTIFPKNSTHTRNSENGEKRVEPWSEVEMTRRKRVEERRRRANVVLSDK